MPIAEFYASKKFAREFQVRATLLPATVEPLSISDESKALPTRRDLVGSMP